MAARWAHNPKVGGSSPPPATKQTAENSAVFFFVYNDEKKVSNSYKSDNKTTFISQIPRINSLFFRHKKVKFAPINFFTNLLTKLFMISKDVAQHRNSISKSLLAQPTNPVGRVYGC